MGGFVRLPIPLPFAALVLLPIKRGGSCDSAAVAGWMRKRFGYPFTNNETTRPSDAWFS